MTTTPFPFPDSLPPAGTKTANADDPLAKVTDARLRAAFEKSFNSKRLAAGFLRGDRGSYINDRLEARYQGFKQAVEGVVTERVSLYDLTSVNLGKYDNRA